MSTVLPNISVVVPASGDTDYPTSISTSLTNIDNHDHTTGKGVQIPTGGIEDLAVTTAKIADLNVTTGKIAANGVTRAKLEPVGQQVSSSCGTFGDSSGSYVDVTNLSVSITTTGRPVQIMVIPDGLGFAPSHIGVIDSGTTAGAKGGLFRILRDATVLADSEVFGQQDGGITLFRVYAPPGALNTLDVVGAGTYVYKLQASSSGTGANVEVVNCKLVAYEL